MFLKSKTASINLLQFLLLLLAMAVILFFAVFGNFPPKPRTNIFSILYPKSKSLANETIPFVDLKVSYQGKFFDGGVDVLADDTPLTLSWKTEGNPSSCIGRVWGISAEDTSWKGPKDPNGGSFITSKLDKNNPYVYTIDCQNDQGDAIGDSVTINVGAKSSNLNPYITSLKLTSEDRKNKTIQFDWSSINTQTPYSVCVASGSWPTGYRNFANSTVSEQFQLNESKTYNYTIYCSNESFFTQNNLSIISQ